MNSYYEINVALHGVHLFATAERSATSEEEMKTLLNELCRRFPKSEGFNITTTFWKVTGYTTQQQDG